MIGIRRGKKVRAKLGGTFYDPDPHKEGPSKCFRNTSTKDRLGGVNQNEFEMNKIAIQVDEIRIEKKRRIKDAMNVCMGSKFEWSQKILEVQDPRRTEGKLDEIQAYETADYDLRRLMAVKSDMR